MDIIDILFIPIWPLGVVIPVLATIVLYKSYSRFVKFVPFVSTVIWFVARIMIMWDVFVKIAYPESRSPIEVDFSYNRIIIFGTISLTLIVLVLSLLSAWITRIILKKLWKRP